MEPDRVVDEFGWEAAPIARVRWLLHPTILPKATADRQ
jgi:hypothetical protein